MASVIATPRSRLRGRTVGRGEPGYDEASRLWNPRYDDVHPALVAYPVDREDVTTAVRYARENDPWLVPRGGGHSFAGFSTGDGCVVLDLGAIDHVSVEPGSETVTVGAGARVIDVYEALSEAGLTISAGECVHVGIAGLTLGGGVGYLSRLHGLTCDALTGLEMVDAEGSVIQVGEAENQDLLWASKGGGGGNFGIATSFRFRAFPAPRVTRFRLRWDWSHAAAVIGAWQAWAPDGPGALNGTVRLENTPFEAGATPRVTVVGCFIGDPDGFAPLNSELVEAVGAPPDLADIAHQEWLDAIRITLEDPSEALYAGCQGQADFDMLTRSTYVREPLPAAGIDAIVEGLERRQADSALNSPVPEFRPGVMLIEPYGGAIRQVASDATAFAHRDELFLLLMEARWHHGHSDPAAHEAWLADWYERLLPFGSGRAYQNYPDRGLENWQQAYYGDNLTRLRQIKSSRDPGGFFRFAQGIPGAET